MVGFNDVLLTKGFLEVLEKMYFEQHRLQEHKHQVFFKWQFTMVLA